MPAASARRSSPPETTSTPAPSAGRVVFRTRPGSNSPSWHSRPSRRYRRNALENTRIMPFQRCGGIAVEGCAHRLGDVANDGDVFRKQNAVTIFEMVHGGVTLFTGGDRGMNGLPGASSFVSGLARLLPSVVDRRQDELCGTIKRRPLRPQPDSTQAGQHGKGLQIKMSGVSGDSHRWFACVRRQSALQRKFVKTHIGFSARIVHPESMPSFLDTSCGCATRRSDLRTSSGSGAAKGGAAGNRGLDGQDAVRRHP